MTFLHLKKLAATAVVLIAASASAMAADWERPAGGYSWEGPYIGGHAGYALLNADNSVNAVAPQNWNQKADGFLGGVLVGYNFQMDRYVLGFEADAGFGPINDRETRPGIGGVKITHHGQHTFRLRGGITHGAALFYATGGLALADFRARSPLGNDKDFFLGFTIGGGVEAKIAENWSLRAEYLYGNYGTKTLNLGAVPVRPDFETHNFRVGFAWHFGHLLP